MVQLKSQANDWTYQNSTEKTSFVVFKYDFCKSRNLSSIEGTLPLDFLEMSSPENIRNVRLVSRR